MRSLVGHSDVILGGTVWCRPLVTTRHWSRAERIPSVIVHFISFLLAFLWDVSYAAAGMS